MLRCVFGMCATERRRSLYRQGQSSRRWERTARYKVLSVFAKSQLN